VTVSAPMTGQFVIPILNCYLANQCIKFKVSSFSRSGDIVGGTKNLNRSRDYNHTVCLGVIFLYFAKT